LRLSSTWELRAQAGATRVESLILEAVAVDPIIAAITGQSTGILAVYQLNYVPSATLSLAKKLPHGSLSFTYDRGVVPGNGVFLTSVEESVGAGYQYQGIQRWTVFLSGGYSRLSSFLQTIGEYRSYNAGVGITRSLGKGLHAEFRVDGRRYDAGIAGFRRNASRATLGVSWSPGGVPLIFW
jgi:hypothetical protein